MRAPVSIHLLVLVTLCSVASASGLMAQEEARAWSIRVAALGIAGEHHTLWLRTGPEKEPVEVPLNIHTFSPPLEFKGPAKLAFYRNAAEAAAEEPPAPLSSTVLKARSSLLVFSPSQDNKGYRVSTIPEREFPFGSFRFVNLSKATVRAELDRRQTLLKPGASETIAFSRAREALPVRIIAAAPGGKPRVIRQSSWSIVPTQRELVFLFPNPQSGLARLRHFVDSKVETPPD